MHRLVTLLVVIPKLHTVLMRTNGRDAAEILLGMHLLDRHLPVLMKLYAIEEQNRHPSINAKLIVFLYLACNTQLYIATCSVHRRGTDIKFCSYFFWSFLSSVVSNRYASSNHI